MGKLTWLDKVERIPESAITVGTFDGVHAGHKVLINRLVEKAKSVNGRSVVVTFDPHPREVLHGGNNTISLLTTLEERASILNEIGVDEMVVIPFDREFSLMDSEAFIRDILWGKIGLKEFIIGYDHQFGRNREGSVKTAKTLSDELGFNVTMVEAQEVDKITVSSTSVRKALSEKGDVGLARAFLGRPYLIKGTVVHGDKRGRTIGYPTANLMPQHRRKVIPLKGVYAVEVEWQGKKYGGMMNIGHRPTVSDEKDLRLEVHIFDFNQEVYGRSLDVRFIKRIRDEKRFSGLEELQSQLDKDKADCKAALK